MLSGVKDPLPSVDHCPVVAPDVTDPFNCAVESPSHTLISVPALTFGEGVNLITTVSVEEGQIPAPVVVRYSFTESPAKSPAPG